MFNKDGKCEEGNNDLSQINFAQNLALFSGLDKQNILE